MSDSLIWMKVASFHSERACSSCSSGIRLRRFHDVGPAIPAAASSRVGACCAWLKHGPSMMSGVRVEALSTLYLIFFVARRRGESLDPHEHRDRIAGEVWVLRTQSTELWIASQQPLLKFCRGKEERPPARDMASLQGGLSDLCRFPRRSVRGRRERCQRWRRFVVQWWLQRDSSGDTVAGETECGASWAALRSRSE